MSLSRARLLGLIEALIEEVGQKNHFIPPHRRCLSAVAFVRHMLQVA